MYLRAFVIVIVVIVMKMCQNKAFKGEMRGALLLVIGMCTLLLQQSEANGEPAFAILKVIDGSMEF